MSFIHFTNIPAFFFLWTLPVLVGFYVYAAYKRKASLKTFAEAGILKQINVNISTSGRHIKLIILLFGLAFIIVGIARPGWNPQAKKVERVGRDVAFIIDVSKSMLAEDLAPNRLERAKLAIIDCVDRLDGDRVALIAFAGTAAMKCPLTLDYGFFRAMVEDISIESIARGGTKIGDAVRKAVNEVFDDKEKRFKDIILITDGEDHDSFPVDAAKEAGDKGVRIIAFGLGDENTGMRIPITDSTGRKTFMKYTDPEGKTTEVWSKLDADSLRKMVLATPDGKYLNVSTGTFDLGKIYLDLVASSEKRQLSAQSVTVFDERYQFFMTIGFLALAAEILVGIRRRKAVAE